MNVNHKKENVFLPPLFISKKNRTINEPQKITMADKPQNEYQPDLVSSPGETLQETLYAIRMLQAELARRMGRPLKIVNEIIQGEAAITTETALQLEQVLHIPASFWLKREQQYRESLARIENL